MIILTIRSDNPQAELGLFEDTQPLANISWLAHRQLATTIHTQLQDMLSSQKMDWADIKGIVGFKGPGSFTGLRIGLTVANSLADGLEVPIVGTSGANWQQAGIKLLLAGSNEHTVMPEYGSEPHITKPRGQ